MRKKIFISVISAVFLLSSCAAEANEAAEPTTPEIKTETAEAAVTEPQSTSESASESTAADTAEETAEAAAAVTEPQSTSESISESTAADTAEKTAVLIENDPIYIAPDGTEYYFEDGTYEDHYLTFDFCSYRPSTGVFYDSVSSPELFDFDNRAFLGEKIEHNISEYKRINSGDTICGYKVQAETSISCEWDEKYLSSEIIRFEDDVTLTGIAVLCGDNSEMMTHDGDICFFPDSSYKGMPQIAVNTEKAGSGFLFTDSDEQWFYGDTVLFYIGSLYLNYSDNEEVNALFGGETNKIIKVKVTLRRLTVAFTEMYGTGTSNAEIVSISAAE